MHSSATSFAILVLILSTTCSVCDARFQIFDVTRFGAVPGIRDNSKAFLAAWEAACQFEGNATFVVPSGSFMLSSVQFSGPCYKGSSPSVEIRGVLKAFPGLRDTTGDRYWIKFYDLNGLSVSGGGELDGQGILAWLRNDCLDCKLDTLKFQKVSNSKIYKLNFVNSKGFHITFNNCSQIHVCELNITAPGDSSNTDGIHISKTDDITISNSVIGTGDDCISIGPGTRNATISDITCGPGHGISVGSLGKSVEEGEIDVIGLVVRNCTMMGTTNGVRIKTWQGSSESRASNLTFEDINMINVSYPIIIDQEYCPNGKDPHGEVCSNEPSQVAISDVRFMRIRGTSRTEVAVKLLCSRSEPCSGIRLDDIRLACSDRRRCSTTSFCSNAKVNFTGVQIPSPCLPGY